jgi:hypothetical protein
MGKSKISSRPFVPCGSFGDRRTAAMNAARALTRDRDPEIWRAVEARPGRWAIQRVS